MPTSTKIFTISKTSYELNSGESLVFKLQLSGITGSTGYNNFTASIGTSLGAGGGELTVSSLAPQTGYLTTTCPYFHSESISTGSNTNEIILSSGLSTFHNAGYIFVPNPATGSSVISLYDTYGTINEQFTISPYDIILILLSDNTYLEARVSYVYTDTSNRLHIALDTVLSQLAKNDLSFGTYKRFLLLKRLEDETNAYLVFRKTPGPTSYGFLIPENLAPDVLTNIDTITKQAKQKLLSDQPIVVESVGGGTF